LNGDNDNRSNGEDAANVNNDHHRRGKADRFRRGKTLTTKHILHPSLYLNPYVNNQDVSIDDDPQPLFSGLRKLIQSLQVIIDEASTEEEEQHEKEGVLHHLKGTTILRIEQSIASVHSIDPLCWLHAQQKMIQSLVQQQQQQRDGNNHDGVMDLPVIYFGDAEGQVEAAAVGKASPIGSYSDSWDPFVGKRTWDVNGDDNDKSGYYQEYNNDDDDISMFKEGDLPPGARVYGGSRFDWQFYQEKMLKRNNNREATTATELDDWDGFGGDRGGFWILPAVELRREFVRMSIPTNDDDDDDDDESENHSFRKVTLSIHVHNILSTKMHSNQNNTRRQGWYDAASHTLKILQKLTDDLSPAVPCTTLPPVLTRTESTSRGVGGGRDDDSELAFERGVTEALSRINGGDGNSSNRLRKVVLARKVELNLGSSVRGIDVLMRMKFGGHIGHIFYMNPGNNAGSGYLSDREFLGCTPERLFRVNRSGHDRLVTSEALAGTRIRGLTPSADAELLHDLLSSKKDMLENEITGNFIRDALQNLEENGLLQKNEGNLLSSYDYLGNVSQNSENRRQRFFVRRLRHLQHICQTFEGKLSKNANVVDVSRSLLRGLHPTPAVCGDSPAAALEFIREFETDVSFDRGLYAGPFGYLGHDSADIVVAIRSALVTNYQEENINRKDSEISENLSKSKISVFGGAGIVEGSTVQGEWTETSHKMGVLSSLFPPSPITLQSFSAPNAAWSTAFIEELIRCGVTQFYICPGSRNTPLTAAIFKATRSNVGIVRAISVHDERGAGFRAVGYARQNGRPAAVITSSGTAVANLYPSVVESSSDGVPLLVITADRPYENRDTGSNQSIDQVKMFSSSYVRWFRDILPPSDDVPVSLALSDANHAVTLTKQLMGPVHLNVQFRENLAPDGGPIRNDNRIGSVTQFNNLRFTDATGFLEWSRSGNRWLKSYYSNNNSLDSMMEIKDLIRKSRRGIIVTGNLRNVERVGQGTDSLSSLISKFAQVSGFPIVAGVQSGALRRESSVIPYAEHLMKNPIIAKGMQPDLIIQLGTPLISTEISGIIKSNPSAKHVLVQQFHPYERADPDHTVTHRISSNIGTFLKDLTNNIESCGSFNFHSELAPLVFLGHKLGKQIPSIISKAASSESGIDVSESCVTLTEPEIMVAISEVLNEVKEKSTPMSLFLSNSMPVRDGEFFLYPVVNDAAESSRPLRNDSRFPISVSVNRGASGIDGIISTATGCGDSSSPTTLVCGDVTTLHDLNAFYGLTADYISLNNVQTVTNTNRLPLTTIIVNNGGGAIFSFLPIAKHGQDVGFEEYWGTPTKNFSFKEGASAFGLPYKSATSFKAFKDAYRSSIQSGGPEIIEAKVVDRSMNVEVHKKITQSAVNAIDCIINETRLTRGVTRKIKLPIKRYSDGRGDLANGSKTLLLIHGWLGDKSEWDMVGELLTSDLSGWDIISIDLPGHGESTEIFSSDEQTALVSLDSNDHPMRQIRDSPFALDALARTVCISLMKDHGIKSLDAVAGYSLGGRVALAMKRLCSTSPALSDANTNNIKEPTVPLLISENTKLILLGSNPGKLPNDDASKDVDEFYRVTKDYSLAESLYSSSLRSYLIPKSQDVEYLDSFLTRWYGAKSLWGDMKQRKPTAYNLMMKRRLENLSERRQDMASVLYGCSPPLTSHDDWKWAVPSNTLFIAGALDEKYTSIGHRWQRIGGISTFLQVPNAGHALIVEDPTLISSFINGFLKDEIVDENKAIEDEMSSRGKIPPSPVLDTTTNILKVHAVGMLEYESFCITVGSSDGNGVQGIGWGSSARAENKVQRREGFIISIVSLNGKAVGVGEVSPLKGLHKESIEVAESQLRSIKDFLNSGGELPKFNAEEVLSLDGSLSNFIEEIISMSGIDSTLVAASVKSGLEMAILSVASQLYGSFLPQALAANHWQKDLMSIPSSSFGLLPISGLITRGESLETISGAVGRMSKKIKFRSVKVKVGHEDSEVNIRTLRNLKLSVENSGLIQLRADANRAWDARSASLFVAELKREDSSILESIEFIEEPLKKQIIDGEWSLYNQVSALEDFTRRCGIPYALDESLADLSEIYGYNFDRIAHELRAVFSGQERVCAAFVLKPALLGLELSMQIASLAQKDFQINAVFSSSFDSGIGLAFTAILASVTDNSPYSTSMVKFSHGLGTFSMLGGDTLSPPFESYVNEEGMLNVPSLSRALYGLSLDEISSRLPTYDAMPTANEPAVTSTESDSYLATTSSEGRDITVSVSLPLPFSDSVASSRFTDLPQMSRWSPWLNSVTYLDAAGLTEWNLNIRGVKFSWKAKSEVLDKPKGIKWESISGLKNRGVVEFEPTSDNACIMKLKMSIIMPYILVSLFQGMPSVVQEFLQNKLLKWSLEMFRDVVKADLALERGDQELGDALFGAVEGRANALEEALK
jgi:2-succinyl-5-enolpyruvyl-6-hydroxy-3-cyclohexene-1-carboxylate synthase